jgi:CheY-like chemotaxis protein
MDNMSVKHMTKILVCDDDAGVLEVLKIMLESKGYEVKTINEGKGIVKLVSDYLPSLIFLDVWMPGIDGREVTKLLKRDPVTKRIPIIVVSALNDTKEVADKAGADDYLSKPFDMQDLFSIVDKYMVGS